MQQQGDETIRICDLFLAHSRATSIKVTKTAAMIELFMTTVGTFQHYLVCFASLCWIFSSSSSFSYSVFFYCIKFYLPFNSSRDAPAFFSRTEEINIIMESHDHFGNNVNTNTLFFCSFSSEPFSGLCVCLFVRFFLWIHQI